MSKHQSPLAARLKLRRIFLPVEKPAVSSLGMDLNVWLDERRRIVDAALENELPAESVPPALLHRAMRYAVFTGGKRLRPVLTLAAAEALGADRECALLPGVAVELLHTYTLVHDDLPCMDDDDERRGKPTCHVAFGEANAVLAGDALQTLAFEVLARARVPGDRNPGALVHELAVAAGSVGVVGGQVEDIAAACGHPGIAAIERIHRLKTAALFRAALRMGAIAAGASDPDLDAITRYALNLGIAFQIVDDLLDGPVDKDSQITSCLSVLSVEEARAGAATCTATALEALREIPDGACEPLACLAESMLARVV